LVEPDLDPFFPGRIDAETLHRSVDLCTGYQQLTGRKTLTPVQNKVVEMPSAA